MGLSKKELKHARDTQLSEHFTLLEFVNSATLPLLVTMPGEHIINKGREFAESVMEPVREGANGGEPLSIISWYRSPELNTAIGGVHRSVHQIFLLGEFLGVGADVTPVDIFSFFSKIPALSIPELRTAIIYPDRGFIHLDSNAGKSEMGFYIKLKSNKKYHIISATEAENIKETLLKRFSLRVP